MVAGQAKRSGVVRARIEPELKATAEAILEAVGLNPSEAIRLFYKQVALSEGLPFEVRIPNAETARAIREARAGRDVTEFADPRELYDALGI